MQVFATSSGTWIIWQFSELMAPDGDIYNIIGRYSLIIYTAAVVNSSYDGVWIIQFAIFIRRTHTYTYVVYYIIVVNLIRSIRMMLFDLIYTFISIGSLYFRCNTTIFFFLRFQVFFYTATSWLFDR